MFVKKSTNVKLVTVDVVVTPTVSVQTEASTAAAGPVTMETDFSAAVKLLIHCITIYKKLS